jgi:hypothetical protein
MTIDDLKVKWSSTANLPKIELAGFRKELINDLESAGVIGITGLDVILIWNVKALTTPALLDILYNDTALDFI